MCTLRPLAQTLSLWSVIIAAIYQSSNEAFRKFRAVLHHLREADPFPGPLEAELCVLLTRYWARKEVHRSVKPTTDSKKHLSLISLSYTPTFQQTAPDGIFLLFSQLREVLIDSTLCFFSALHCKGFSNLNTEASPHCYSFVNSLRSQWLYGCSQQGAACSPLPEAL